MSHLSNTTQKSRIFCLWSNPRSRSTALTKAWRSRKDCKVLIEPFMEQFSDDKYTFEYSDRQYCENIKYKLQSMQEAHIKDIILVKEHCWVYNNFFRNDEEFINLFPEGTEHFFIIREPRASILSHVDAMQKHTKGTVKTENFPHKEYSLLPMKKHIDTVNRLTHNNAIIVNSDELIRSPSETLTELCKKLNVPFTEHMLSWEAEEKEFMQTPIVQRNPVWFEDVNKSTGFHVTSKFSSHTHKMFFETLPSINMLLHEQVLENDNIFKEILTVKS